MNNRASRTNKTDTKFLEIIEETRKQHENSVKRLLDRPITDQELDTIEVRYASPCSCETQPSHPQT